MSLRFIIGPAGSGKTRYIMDSAIDALSSATGAGVLSMPPILIIVPDQATFQMEKALLEDGRIEGFMNLHVLGFRRLCLRVLDETGGITEPFITTIGKSMAVQSILWRHKNELKVYAPMVDYPGFREAVTRVFSEFNAYGVTPSDLEIAAGREFKAPQFLSQKLSDLGFIYGKYLNFLRERFLDPDDCLHLAAARISGSRLLRNATVWLDGFSGFTPQEYKVIGAMLKTAARVNVALCMDREEIQYEPQETSLFHPSRQVYEEILCLCREKGIALENTLILGGERPLPRFKNPELSFIESAFRNRGGENRCVCKDNGVVLVSAVNPKAEVEFVAREISKLAREKGFRYKDMIVELRDLEKYKDTIEMVFKDHGIPFFLDVKQPLAHHPLAELIRAAFDIVRTNFGFDALFRYLKTGLVPIGEEMVDELENYVLASGIRGSLWICEEPWRYAGQFLQGEDDFDKRADIERMDEIRREAVAAFSGFHRRLEKGQELTAKLLSMAVYQLLIDLDVPRTLSQWQAGCERRGDLISALEHAGIWDKTLEILEQSVEILGDQGCTVDAFASIVNAGLEDVKLGAIPPSLDQVLVGGLLRSRQPECRVTFLMGAIEGDLPMKQGEEGVFTDGEREVLQKAGLDLEPSSKVKQFHEQYLVYVALTRPQETLYITYPLGDDDGNALFASPVVSWLKQKMPHKQTLFVSIEPPGTYPEDLDYVLPGAVWGAAVRRMSMLRQGILPGAVWYEVYRWMLSPSRIAYARRLLGSLSFSNRVENLGGELSRALYGSPLKTSVSRLERFQRCPFQHFAGDGLGLKEREVFKLDPLKTGSFFHEAMREFVKGVSTCEKEVSELEQKDVFQIIDGAVKGLIPKIQNELFLSSSRYQHVSNALAVVLRRSALLFLEHMKRGQFRPLAVEVPFGLFGGLTPYAAKVPGSGDVLLRGRIDRVDVARLGRDLYLRIVDYKSGSGALDFNDVYHGLSLQLLVYLIVALSKWRELLKGPVVLPQDIVCGYPPRPPRAAGALYRTVKDPFIKTDRPIDAQAAWREQKKELRMDGLVLNDTKVVRLMDGTTEAGHSDIIPVFFNKAGGIGGASKAVSEGSLKALLDYTGLKVGKISGDIISGRIDISPFQMGSNRACTYCPFGPLCGFDVLLEGNTYNVLKKVSEKQVWEMISRALAGGK